MAVYDTDDRSTIKSTFFGREMTFEYSERWIASAILVLRIAMGWVFLQAGLDKLFTPGGWTAAGFLQNAIPAGNPFGDIFIAMAGSPVVDALNIWGQILIGIALILGIGVRFSAFWGAIMMMLYWAAGLQGGPLQGFPLEHGWLIDDHVIYAALLFGLGAFGAGRIVGLDGILEETEFVKNNKWLEVFLG